jgi:hypothetical protein
MLNKNRQTFRIEGFEPLKIRKAQQSLDKHFNAAKHHEQINEEYKQTVFKPTLWEKVLGLFKGKS